LLSVNVLSNSISADFSFYFCVYSVLSQLSRIVRNNGESHKTSVSNSGQKLKTRVSCSWEKKPGKICFFSGFWNECGFER